MKEHRFSTIPEAKKKALSIKKKFGYISMKEILDNIEIPAAIFATSDLIILGCIKAALESNFKIPDQISFLGYDNLFFCDFINPQLTAINHPKKKMGIVSGEMIVDLILGEKVKEKRIFLETEVVKRSSVKNLLKS